MSDAMERRIAGARALSISIAIERLGFRHTLRRAGSSEFCGPCPCGRARRDGFSINIRKNVFLCRPSGAAGDAIDLARHIAGSTFCEALDALLGPAAIDAPGSPSGLTPAAPDDHAITAERDNLFKLAIAAKIIREAGPVYLNTPGARYLREIRRIDTGAIRDVLETGEALRWHPSVPFSEKGHPLHGRRFGCLVGIMSDPLTARRIGSISRTYIADDLTKIAKAKGLGKPAGIVRLSADEDAHEGLILAEGLETALTAMALGLRPTWSTGSTVLMRAFSVVSGIESLTLIADHDPNGAGLSAACEAAMRWHQAGREARIRLPHGHGDLNDRLREKHG